MVGCGWIEVFVYCVIIGFFNFGIIEFILEKIGEYVGGFLMLDLLCVEKVCVCIDEIVKDLEIVKVFKFWYFVWCKCLIFSDEYL